MQNSIILNDREISYTIRRAARTRRIKILVRGSGAVEVVTPLRAISPEILERFLRQSAEWILKSVDKAARRAPSKKIVGTYRAHKEAAREFVHARILQFNEHYKCSIGRVAIRDQSTRWGSCSGQGNLNFNFRLVLIEPDLAEYIIAHEICHIKELNHSPRFWALVAQTIPDYKARVKRLRQYSLREG